MVVREARPAELRQCLHMILSTSSHNADDGYVITFAQSAKVRGIDPARTVVAAVDDQIVWCALPVVFPGKTTMYLSGAVPQGVWPAARQVVDSLLRQHTQGNLQLAQVLLDPSDAAARGFYESCGFVYLAELIYLEARAREVPVDLPPAFELLNYTDSLQHEFAAAIQVSYVDTLDCPRLSGVRHIDDVIAGHKAAGTFSPRYWFLVRENGQPRAVLLLSPVPPSDAMELVYIGLAVEGRRRGLSDALMRLAFSTAAQAGCNRLTTAVDSQNTPAMRMYMRHGMRRIGSRVAMMRLLTTPLSPGEPGTARS